MGVIQNAFNQMLTMGAAAGAVVGREIGSHKMEQQKLAKEGEQLDAEMTKAEKEAGVIENQMTEYETAGGDKRLKAYRSLKTQLGEKQTQLEGFAERMKVLKEKELTEEGKFKKGVFGMNKAFKQSKEFNEKVDKIVRGED